MKIFKNIIYIIPILILSTLLFPQKALATQFHFKSYTLPQEETLNEDIYIFAEEVSIEGVVNGDLIIFADTINISGTVTGDTYTFGSKIDIDSNIYGLLFVFGNNISLEGTFAQNIYTFSSYLKYNGNTPKDLTSFFYDSNIKGSVGDDLRIFGYRSNVDTIVRGDMILMGDRYISNEEKVTGEIFYNSTLKDLAKEQGVDVDKAYESPKVEARNNWRMKLTMNFISFIGLCITGFVIITLTPVKTIDIRKKITDSPSEFFKSLLVGFGILVLIPLPLFVLSISFVGSSLALFLIGLLLFIIIFGRIWVETAFGKEILEVFGVEEYRPFKSLLVGRILSALINLIPIVRGIYNSTLVFVSLGAVVRMKNEYYSIAKQQAKKVVKKK